MAAAREIYRGNVTIDIRLEEGSAKLWATVIGVLTVLHIGYGIVADYNGFKESITAICEDARQFGTFVSGHFLQDAAVTPSQVYRVERRLKVPGKIKRVITELERLENAKLAEAELAEEFHSVQQKLAQIEKELSPQEVDGLNQILRHFETTNPLRESPPQRRLPSLPRVAIKPEQPGLSSEQPSMPYAEPEPRKGCRS